MISSEYSEEPFWFNFTYSAVTQKQTKHSYTPPGRPFNLLPSLFHVFVCVHIYLYMRVYVYIHYVRIQWTKMEVHDAQEETQEEI